MGCSICVHIEYGHRTIFCMGTWRQARQSRTEAIRRSYENRVMPVQLQCSLHRFCMEIIRCLCGLSTEARQSWCGECARNVCSSYDIFCPNDHLKTCDFCKISVWPQHYACTMHLQRVYRLTIFFKFVISPH